MPSLSNPRRFAAPCRMFLVDFLCILWPCHSRIEVKRVIVKIKSIFKIHGDFLGLRTKQITSSKFLFELKSSSKVFNNLKCLASAIKSLHENELNEVSKMQ